MTNRALHWLLVLTVVTGINACGEGGPTGSGHPLFSSFVYEIPEQTDDGLVTGHLSDYGFDLGTVTSLGNRILDGTYVNIHSVLIVKDGVLVLDEYFPGRGYNRPYTDWDKHVLHSMHSVTKSYTSALIGIAIDQGQIASVDDKISTYLPEYADVFEGSERDSIRIKHLLSMTAGLYWDEWTYPYDDIRNTHVALASSSDPVRYALELPVVAAPGEVFQYNSGMSITLGRIVHNASGLTTDRFAEQYLFEPLGITDYYWYSYPDGTFQTGGGLWLRSRDMAKFGLLYLNGGRWGDQQVVSEGWVVESVEQHAPGIGYGYQWWLGYYGVGGQVIDAYSARGRGGQFIFVLPEADLVVVFTGWNDNELANQAFEMLREYVLAALM
ncbi:MAG: serine hydrolase [Gemmatimonadota bacterium]|nr:MAG: serine hydrolase [Gemmatimonadota bacterium]